MAEENSLAHHGVLGQKWGVRKRRNTVTKAPASGVGRSPHTAPKTARKLSDNQLNDRIKRLEMERKYNELLSGSNKSDLAKQNEAMQEYVRHLELKKKYAEITAPPPSKAKKFVGDVLGNSGKTAATTLSTAVLIYAGKKALEKSVGPGEAAKMFPKKK